MPAATKRTKKAAPKTGGRRRAAARPKRRRQTPTLTPSTVPTAKKKRPGVLPEPIATFTF